MLLVESVAERGYVKPAAAAESSQLNRTIDAQSCSYWSCVIAGLKVLSGTTTFLASKTTIKGKRGKAKEYERFLVHIPSKIAKDSQFPFKAGQELAITVDPKGKIVLKA